MDIKDRCAVLERCRDVSLGVSTPDPDVAGKALKAHGGLVLTPQDLGGGNLSGLCKLAQW